VHVAHIEENMHTVFLCKSLMNGHLKDLRIAVRTTSKHILQIRHRHDPLGSGNGLVACFCEHGNKLSDSIKGSAKPIPSC
jgi:hypothetical protein